MKLIKTEKARQELANSSRILGRKERNLIILADGQKTLNELGTLLQLDALTLAQTLILDGYLAVLSTSDIPVEKVSDSRAIKVKGSADNFEGHRSLASTRMYLFDIAERFFVRAAPHYNKQFREALRQARDQDSMMTIAMEMLQAIEDIAGADRAESIRRRLERLLPLEKLAA